MKTNVSINLNDTERRLLADFIDNKKTNRLATRAEIIAIARLAIERSLLAEVGPSDIYDLSATLSAALIAKIRDNPADSLCPCLPNQAETPDPEDAEYLADKSPGHVRGWNQVKHEAEVKKRNADPFGPG